MNWKVALRLGRVSNLPTVWTNVLAGFALAEGPLRPLAVATVLVAVSLSYVAGMYLNDYFDRDIDARERPERPIPAGQAAAGTVAAAGFGLLIAGLMLLAPAAWWAGNPTPLPSLLAGATLATAIVCYDARHERTRLAPAIMGACRVLVYVTAVLVFGGSMSGLAAAAGATLFVHVAALSGLAAGETRTAPARGWPVPALFLAPFYGIALAERAPLALVLGLVLAAWTGGAVRLATRRDHPEIGVAVGRLIAGISLVDAMVIAGAGQPYLALAAVSGCGLTRALQRRLPGT